MSDRFSAFLTGGLIGLAVGVLFAPRPGRETRDQLRKRTDDLIEQGRGSYEAQKGRVLEAVDVGREAALERTEELKAKINETKGKLKSQVDAVAESAREKINAAAEKVAEVKEVHTDESRSEPQE